MLGGAIGEVGDVADPAGTHLDDEEPGLRRHPEDGQRDPDLGV